MDDRRPLAIGTLHGLTVAATALVGVFVLQLMMREALLADLRNYLGRTVDVVAAAMDGTAHARLRDSASTMSTDYVAQVRPLELLMRGNPDVRFAYTAIIRGDSMYFVLDGDTRDRAWVMEPSAATAGMLEVWRTGVRVIDRTPSVTDYGEGIRAYAPIHHPDGHVTGFVGVTMSAGLYRDWIRRLDLASLIGFGASVLLALAGSARVVRSERLRQQAAAEMLRAKELADHSARVKSQFLANMSHEIRTPLNGVLGFADLLKGTQLDAEQRSYVDTMLSSGSVLLGVVNDTLEFSRVESGRVELARGPVDPLALTREVTHQFQAAANQKGIELRTSMDPTVPSTITADDVRIRQILLNLIGNAVKFTARGHVEVSVRRRATGLVWEVRDTGIGIAADKLSLIFEAFAQADGSMARRFGGTGLGLAIARNLAQLMGGELEARSDEGKGATFVLTLPLSFD